jgi:hypothetical protein
MPCVAAVMSPRTACYCCRSKKNLPGTPESRQVSERLPAHMWNGKACPALPCPHGGDLDTMLNSCSARRRQRLKIEEIGTTLADCGFVELEEQADVLGLSRSTAWTVVRATHKTSGLCASTINRMLASDHLPLQVRLKLLEYVAEKMSGAYGDRNQRLKAFASKIAPEYMFLVQPNQAARWSCGRYAA